MAASVRSCSEVIVGMGLLCTLACRVDPSADYARTAQIITEHTASTQSYSPLDHAGVEQRVERLLQDGLTVAEAVEITLLNNPGFQSLFEEVGISRADVVQAGLVNNPVISAVLKFPEGGGRISLDFGIAQEITQLWRIPIQRGIAKAKLDQTIATVAQRAVDLAAQAKTSYYRLRTRQIEEETLLQNVEIVAESVRTVERQVENGAASPLDLNFARVATMDVQLELLAVRRQRESAEIELGRTLGLPPQLYPRRLIDPLPAAGRSWKLEGLMEFAETERLDLRRAGQQVAAAENEAVRQSLLVFPSIIVGLVGERPERQSLPGRNVLADTARASVRSGALTAPDIQSRGQRAQTDRQFIDFLIGPSFQATIPLFDQNQAQMAIAAFGVRQRRRDYQDLLTLVQSEIAQSLSALQTASQQAEIYQREALPIAEANEAASRTVFAAGAQSILVVLEAQRSLVSRRRAYVLVQGDYASTIVELERVVGGRLPVQPSSQPAASSPEALHG